MSNSLTNSSPEQMPPELRDLVEIQCFAVSAKLRIAKPGHACYITGFTESIGICCNVAGTSPVLRAMLENLMTMWPEYSGCWEFPVGYPDEAYSAGYAAIAYDRASELHTLWAMTPYGDARRRLLAFLAELPQQTYNDIATIIG